jgi:hypothetical protein
MNDAMDLRVTQERTAEGTRRTVHLNNLRNSERENLLIFFDMIGERDAPEPFVLDGFVFGIIFYAMGLAQGVRVHGRMSTDALRNLNEFQEAWTLWKGKIYTKVDIVPDEIVDCMANGEREAIAAFSGGVDSMFTVIRHATGRLGLASYPLKKAVLLVHGFDVPLAEPEQLEALKERTRPFVRELNLEVRTIRTNLKELCLQDWEDSFMSQLAACLHNYSHEFSCGLVGSSESYDSLVLPWGSNPATDHLLSGAALRIVHDGAGYSRTRKVEEIAKNPTATSVVKVCWEGRETFKNCGLCEKCMRTLLNFLAVGVVNPPCFSEPLDILRIREIPLHNDAQCAELVSIVAYVKAKGIEAEWINELEIRVKAYRHSGELRKDASLWNMVKRGEWMQIARNVKKRLF